MHKNKYFNNRKFGLEETEDNHKLLIHAIRGAVSSKSDEM